MQIHNVDGITAVAKGQLPSANQSAAGKRQRSDEHPNSNDAQSSQASEPAVALNAGNFRWPRHTNAAEVIIDGKRKIVLKGEEDCWKGVGVVTSLVFGNVHGSKRRPNHAKFKPIQTAPTRTAVSGKLVAAIIQAPSASAPTPPTPRYSSRLAAAVNDPADKLNNVAERPADGISPAPIKSGIESDAATGRRAGGTGESGETQAGTTAPAVTAAMTTRPVVQTNSPDFPIPPEGAGASYYPADSVLGRFVCYCESQIETAKIFIVGGALTIASLLTNRRIHFPWGGKDIYPNQYMALVGPSGVSRKSELLALVRSIVDELCPSTLLADYSSHERLVECFVDEPVRGMIYPEGKNFVDALNASPALVGDMLQLYDGATISTDYKSNDQGDGRTRIEARNTYLTILIGLPPQCFRFSSQNQHNGLLSRFEALYAARRERDILLAPPDAEQHRRQLIEDFRALQQVEGPMHFGAGAEAVWLAMQEENRRLLDDNPPEQVAGYLSRMPFSILRIAMLYEVATTGGFEISADSLRLAGRMAENCRAGYMEFLGDMTKTGEQRLEERILTTLRRTGCRAGHSPLLKSVTRHGEWSAAEFKAALTSLAARDAVRFVGTPTAKFPDVELIAESAAEPTPASSTKPDEIPAVQRQDDVGLATASSSLSPTLPAATKDNQPSTTPNAVDDAKLLPQVVTTASATAAPPATATAMSTAAIRDRMSILAKLFDSTTGVERANAVEEDGKLRKILLQIQDEKSETVLTVPMKNSVTPHVEIKVFQWSDGAWAVSLHIHTSTSGSGGPFYGKYATKEDAIKQAIGSVREWVEREAGGSGVKPAQAKQLNTMRRAINAFMNANAGKATQTPM